MKKILSILTLAVLVSASTMTALASTSATNTAKSGCVEEIRPATRELPQSIKVSEEEEEVGGGTWIHGISYDLVWSDYQHEGSVHSSACSNWSYTESSGWQDPGAWANCKIKASLWGNKAYWDVY